MRVKRKTYVGKKLHFTIEFRSYQCFQYSTPSELVKPFRSYIKKLLKISHFSIVRRPYKKI